MKKRLDSLQALRGIAFLGIFTCHCEIGLLGTWGVSIFLILSGFVLYYNYHDRFLPTTVYECIRFSANKIRRLYPLHIIMTFCMFWVVYLALMYQYSLRDVFIYLFDFVLNVFLLQSWVPIDNVYFSFNGVSWYLCVCTLIYALFPCILPRIKAINTVKGNLMAIGLIYAAQLFFFYLSTFVPFNGFTRWFVYICPAFRVGDFVMGCCLGNIFVNGKLKINKKYASFFEVISFLIVAVIVAHMHRIEGSDGYEWQRMGLAFALPSCAIVLLFAFCSGVISRACNNKALVYIGNISAYTFLIHQVVIKNLNAMNIKFWGGNLDKIPMALIAFLISILLAEAYKNLQNRAISRRV